MTSLVAKPHPVADPGTAPYWDALRSHRFILRSCRSCGSPHFYPREACPICFSDDLEWVEAAGTGVIYSYTVCHRPAGPAFAGDAPYVVAIVALGEGPRLMTRINAPASELKIGDAVEVVFEHQDDDLVLPFFRPVQSTDRVAEGDRQ